MTQNHLALEELYALISDKIKHQEENSYSYTLAQEGVAKIGRKVGEEALEVVIAAFANDRNPNAKHQEELVGEVCDLLYHSLVLLASQNIEFSAILAELTRRNTSKK